MKLHHVEFVDAFCEFLELAIHTILFARELYPQAIFERREKYGIPVFMSRHPVLNSYVRESIENAKEWLQKDQVDRVSVSILSSKQKITERYNFEVGMNAVNASSDLSKGQLFDQMRAFILRIQSFKRPVPPQDSTFTIEVHKKGEAAEENSTLWVPVDELAVENAELHALKSLHTSICKLQLFVETATMPVSSSCSQ